MPINNNKYRIWYSTRGLADWLVRNTDLNSDECEFEQLAESDASKPNSFHRVPTHLKNILYLDSPDLIVESDSKPIFSLEVSTEAGTGHNAFQRFARISASIENNVPAFYIYPEACYVYRSGSPAVWDKLNPNIFKALEKGMRIYNIPALLYYFPSHFRSDNTVFQRSTKGLIFDNQDSHCPDARNEEMKAMFSAMNLILRQQRERVSTENILNEQVIEDRRNFMMSEMHEKMGVRDEWSPVTSTEIVSTKILVDYLRKYAGPEHDFGDMLTKRNETVIYKVNANFRGDPYPGAIAALDYLLCRKGKSYEDRSRNLVLLWGDASIDENERLIIDGDKEKSVNKFVESVKQTYDTPGKILLDKTYNQLDGEQIPRYFMQVRFGSTFTKVKHIRVYAYYCDAILFHDGALWREG